ncbi:MAG: Flp family type IVb pilin [Nocardioides sp.]|nr:Flp family type IVb pilin [Nocardioides sp.]
MLDHLRSFLITRRSRRGQRGATAVEYGLLIAGIAAVIAVVVYALGGVVLTNLFQSTCDSVSQHIRGTQCR